MRQNARENSRHYQNGSVGPLWDGLKKRYRLLWCNSRESENRAFAAGAEERIGRKIGELRPGCDFLPHTPGAAHVIGQRHSDENDEGEESGGNRQLGELGTVPNVHEEKNYE